MVRLYVVPADADGDVAVDCPELLCDTCDCLLKPGEIAATIDTPGTPSGLHVACLRCFSDLAAVNPQWAVDRENAAA